MALPFASSVQRRARLSPRDAARELSAAHGSDELLAIVTRVLCRAAGAAHGVLLVERDGDWVVGWRVWQASYDVEPPQLLAVPFAVPRCVRTAPDRTELQFAGPMLWIPLPANGSLSGLAALDFSASPRPGTTTLAALELLAFQAGAVLATASGGPRRRPPHPDRRTRRERYATVAAMERRRLARELHDSVAQSLFSATLIADTLPELWANNPVCGAEALADLKRFTHGAHDELRLVLSDLRDETLAATPLHQLLPRLLDDARARQRLLVDARLERTPLVAAEVQNALYRLAQEALNNVIKHADATRVQVRLSAGPALQASTARAWHGSIRLLVADNGRGFAPESVADGQLGLRGMHERAQAVGASLTIAGRPGVGTTVTVHWNGAAR